MLCSGIKSASAQSYKDKCGADRQSGKTHAAEESKRKQRRIDLRPAPPLCILGHITEREHCGCRKRIKTAKFAAEKIRAAFQAPDFELLAISGLGRIRVAIIHSGEQPIQRGNLLQQLLVLCALKLQRQLIDAPLDLCARELFRQDKLDRHPRCISQRRTKRQQFSILRFVSYRRQRHKRNAVLRPAKGRIVFPTSLPEQSVVALACELLWSTFSDSLQQLAHLRLRRESIPSWKFSTLNSLS